MLTKWIALCIRWEKDVKSSERQMLAFPWLTLQEEKLIRYVILKESYLCSLAQMKDTGLSVTKK